MSEEECERCPQSRAAWWRLMEQSEECACLNSMVCIAGDEMNEYEEGIEDIEQLGESSCESSTTNNLMAQASSQVDAGRLMEARALYELAFRAAKIDSDRIQCVEGLSNISAKLNTSGRSVEAEAVSTRVVALYDDTSFLNTPTSHLARSLTQLGRCAQANKSLKVCQRAFQRAVSMYCRAYGHDHVFVATSLGHLANVLYKKGDFEEAAPMYERALRIRIQALPNDHVDIATSLNNLALIRKKTGKPNDAFSLYERALKIRVRALGASHPEVAVTMTNLAILCSETNQQQRAVHYFRKALRVHEARLNPAHPDLIQPIRQLAAALVRADQYSQADSVYQRLLAVTGNAHPDDLSAHAHVLMHLQEYTHAEAALEEAITASKRDYGPESAQVACALSELALCRRRNHRIDPSTSFCEQLLERALAIYLKKDPTSEAVATTYDNLGLVLLDAARSTEAATVFDKAVRIRLECQGPHHSETLDSLALYRKAREMIARTEATAKTHDDDLVAVVNECDALNIDETKKDFTSEPPSATKTVTPTTVDTEDTSPSTPEHTQQHRNRRASKTPDTSSPQEKDSMSAEASPPVRKNSIFRSISGKIVSPNTSPPITKRRWSLRRPAQTDSISSSRSALNSAGIYVDVHEPPSSSIKDFSLPPLLPLNTH